MSEMKMSDMFELPVRASQLEVYGANSNPGITFEDIEKAAAHAINNHDRLIEENKRLREALGNYVMAVRKGSFSALEECYKESKKLLS